MKLNTTNIGILLGGAAVFYLLFTVAKNGGIGSLVTPDGKNQYASVGADNYDWIQDIKNSKGKITYV